MSTIDAIEHNGPITFPTDYGERAEASHAVDFVIFGNSVNF